MNLNIHDKHKKTNMERKSFGVYQNDGELDFSSFLHQAVKELTTWKWHTVSDINHSSQKQILYGSLRPTVNTDQSVTESSVDKIKYYTLSITQ
jgi:hypothetical protein